MTIQGYPVFDKWITILDWILDRVEKFPKSVRFTLSTRIVNISLDILESIVEAIYTKKRSYILRRINLYIEKLRVLFRICFKRRYISTNQYEFISSEIMEFGKMIGGWIKHELSRAAI